MNFGGLLKAFETAMALREVTQRVRGAGAAPPRPPEATLSQPAMHGLAGQIEARLTNVVVAALKEAFDRDHARLELERNQLDEQRRRAEEALRAEVRRQAADREVSRLRLLAGTALVGWIASLLLLGWRLPLASMSSRIALGLSWLLLLGALGAAFGAMARVGSRTAEGTVPLDHTSAPLWLLLAGLALAAGSILI